VLLVRVCLGIRLASSGPTERKIAISTEGAGGIARISEQSFTGVAAWAAMIRKKGVEHLQKTWPSC
jgi:hypothetical protein